MTGKAINSSASKHAEAARLSIWDGLQVIVNQGNLSLRRTSISARLGCDQNTYALTLPLLLVEEDVVTTFSAVSEWLGNHHIILGQPQTELLMISPIALVASFESVLFGAISRNGLLTVLLLPPIGPHLQEKNRT